MSKYMLFILFQTLYYGFGFSQEMVVSCDTTLSEQYYQTAQSYYKVSNKDTLEMAVEELTKAIAVLSPCTDTYPILITSYYNLLGTVYRYYLHHPIAARTVFEKELSIIEKHNISGITAYKCYYNLATTLRIQLEFTKGIAYGLQALEIAGHLDDKQRLARCHIMIASLYHDNGNYSKAINHYTNAQELSRYFTKISDQVNITISLFNILIVTKQIDQATIYLDRLQGFINSGFVDAFNTKIIYLCISDFYKENNNLEKAQYYLKLVFDIIQLEDELDFEEFAELNQKLGLLDMKQGKLNSALNYHKKALESYRKAFPTAKNYNEQLLSNIDLLIYLDDLAYIQFLIYSRDNTQYALEDIYQQYITIDSILLECQQFGDEDDILHILGHSHNIYEHAMEVTQQLFEQTKQPKYIEQLFYFAERNKANTFSKQKKISSDKGNTLSVKHHELSRSIQSLKHQIQVGKTSIVIYEQLEKSLDSLELIQDELYQTNPDFLKFQPNSDQFSLLKLQEHLQSKKAGLLQYFWSEKQLYMLYADKDKIQSFVLTETEKLKKDILALQTILIEGKLDFITYKKFIELSSNLYSQLVAPFQNECKNIDELVIIKDGILEVLPFEVLLTSQVDSNQGFVDYKNLPYFIKNLPISYRLSSRIMLQEEAPVNVEKILISIYKGSSQSKDLIVNTVKELQTLQNIFLLTSQKVLIDTSNTIEQFCKSSPLHQIIHLGSHAKSDKTNRFNQRIQFYSNDNSASYLYPKDIEKLNLNNALTVIAACETNLGTLKKGEGTYSLARAFRLAGTHAVIASNWEVVDGASSDILATFYTNVKDKSSLSKSLQSAKLQYIKNSDEQIAHPSFWGVYTLLGESDLILFFNHKSNFVYNLIVIIIVLLLLILMDKKYTNARVHPLIKPKNQRE